MNNYLENIAHKVQRLSDAKETAIKYLIKHQIKDKDKIENCVVMSQIWAAHTLGERFTMTDLNIALGGNDDEVIDHRELVLDEKYVGQTLIQMLDIILELDYDDN